MSKRDSLGHKRSRRVRSDLLGGISIAALSVTFAMGALMVASEAMAGPDACAVAGGIATCALDQSAGISFTGGAVTTIDVQNLSLPITPADAVNGISLQAVGATGAAGPAFSLTTDSSVSVTTDLAQAIVLNDSGGIGATGSSGTFGSRDGGDGQAGGGGGDITLTNEGALTSSGASAIDIATTGGQGGVGGEGYYEDLLGTIYRYGTGGTAGVGGAGGVITVTNSGVLSATGDNAHGIIAISLGGAGNIGGYALSNGTASAGGSGGAVQIANSAGITTDGANASALFGRSQGGQGSDGTYGGSSGLTGGNAGTVTISNSAAISTQGMSAYGIFADSDGGDGGNGLYESGAIVSGGNGGNGGAAGAVTLMDSGAITTSGVDALGIFAHSLGGNGGDGGGAVGGVAYGGSGGAGGSADSVTVTLQTDASIATSGTGANAVDAESIGGTGGAGGNAGAAVGTAAGGGAGGSGGAVSVTVDGTVDTSGNDADGVLAMSLGSPGGYGGTGVGIVAFGGYGGGGSKGGAVTVLNNGSISTTGSAAFGISALSVGGGGGIGGIGGGLVSFGGGGPSAPAGCSHTSGSTSTDRSLCNDGGAVTVTNAGSITTSGQFSAAISAASIGGGGGDGSEAVGAFSFGGSGGEGGDGGAVTVTNTASGSIVTTGDDAQGIAASSIGGGGGFGGGALAIGVSTQVAVGGSGGNGGDGGSVAVVNDGTISTLGENSTAIFAESVGGGGGNAGDAEAAGLSAFTLSLGGSGGGGGNGGDVSVTNIGALDIENDQSYGIFAQSVGGGGGNGGAGTSFGASPVFNLAVSLGGSGGSGGVGSAVTVANSGSILTDGEDDVAIFAQSVGGGGGTGGAASATGIGISGGDIPAVAISFAMGGTGGDGGDGGAVDVTNSGAISTLGDASHGIEAQSVGGGGGKGGDASATATALAGGAGSLQIAIQLGGSGGVAGDGGSVDVNNSGTISTLSQRSYGIFAQSVGGGGGEGGAGGASEDILDKVGKGAAKFLTKKALGTLNSNSSSSESKEFQLNLSMGGSGGAAGNGGAVTIANTGSIVTQGYNSIGILAQSVGGGGGAGGAGVGGGVGAETPTKMALKETIAGSVAIGGNGGASGDGGDVSVDNEGTVMTFGGDASAIFAQSVGGGGGIADTGADDAGEDIAGGQGGEASGGAGLTSINFNVGGNGSASGSGGTVSVNQTGDIATFGDSSFGIEAQSIGGGGGQGGDATNGYTGKVAVGGEAGAAGNGGEVDVNMSGNIVTTGAGSYGIFAQSVGGGGGVSGSIAGNAKTVDLPSETLTVNVPVAFGQTVPASITTPEINFTLPSFVGLLTVTRNGSGGGNGGAVNVTDIGNITTSGVGADGIFAQSIGGGGGLAGTSATSALAFFGSDGNAGNGGAVTVNHTGDIIATGNDASAIFAQSVGGTASSSSAEEFASFGHVFDTYGDTAPGTGSDITLAVAGGTFEGGGDSGAGIWIDNGLVNTITIANSATVEALSGVAIKATEDSGLIVNTINNFGIIIGDVDVAGTNANSFKNESGAILAPNTKVDLAGGTLTNLGTLSPGGLGTAATVAVNGNLVEAAGSNYIVDLGYGLSASDQINVTGNASVGGTISPHFVSIMNQPVTLLTTTGTLTNAGATVSGNTVVVTYGLSFSATALTLNTVANWNPSGLNTNESGVGAYLQSIWNAGGSTTLAAAMGQLANITSYSNYADALNHLGPGAYLVTLSGLQGDMTNFADSLMSCHGTNGSLSPISEQDCVWSEISPSSEEQSTTNSSLGYKGYMGRAQIGGQQHLDEDWVIGGSLGYDAWERNVTGLAQLEGQDFSAGVVSKYLQGPWVNAAAMTLDYGTFSALRTLTVPTTTTVSGNSDLFFVGLRGRSTYLLNADPVYFKPYVDVDLDYYHMGGFTEQGDDILGLRVDGVEQTSVSLTPMLEVGTTQQINDTYFLRPFIAGGVALSNDGDWSVSAGFEGAPPSAADMTVKQDAHSVFERFNAGIELLSMDDVLLRVQYEGHYAPHFSESDEMLKLGFKF